MKTALTITDNAGSVTIWGVNGPLTVPVGKGDTAQHMAARINAAVGCVVVEVLPEPADLASTVAELLGLALPDPKHLAAVAAELAQKFQGSVLFAEELDARGLGIAAKLTPVGLKPIQNSVLADAMNGRR